MFGSYFRSTPLTEIIDDLSLSNDKLIPAEELTVESVILWSNLVKHVQELQESEEDYLELILPELFPFTIYLEK